MVQPKNNRRVSIVSIMITINCSYPFDCRTLEIISRACLHGLLLGSFSLAFLVSPSSVELERMLRIIFILWHAIYDVLYVVLLCCDRVNVGFQVLKPTARRSRLRRTYDC